MGRIAEKKKELILTTAKKVFLEKGFAHVTMKDIVDACGISRGGLYLYYSSTKEIFLKIFERDAALTADTANVAIWEGRDAADILLEVFDAYKSAMMTDEHQSMAHAVYEFFMTYESERVVKQWQFDGLCETIRQVLSYGVERGEFNDVDTTQYARQIALFLDGLILTYPLIGLHEEEIDSQLALLISPILKDPSALKAHKRPATLIQH